VDFADRYPLGRLITGLSFLDPANQSLDTLVLITRDPLKAQMLAKKTKA
jgi:hypothetical protein